MIRVLREVHETPATVAERLLRAGGRNRFGEANYRAVWGWNRLTWIGGKWEDWGEDGRLIREVVEVRLEPKYPQRNRWHIERWVPPEVYGSPASWYRNTIETENGVRIPALGPYPSRGDYEHCFVLEDAKGEFVQLTSAAAEHIVRAVEMSRRISRSAGRAALYRREERSHEEYQQWAFELLDDAAPAFRGDAFVTVV